MKIKNRKSQTEILGFAIVVVLILVAVFFVIRLGFSKPSAYRSDFIDSELASNMLSAFLKTSANDCSHMSMNAILQDCGQSGRGNGLKCNGKFSCEFAESAAAEIFSKTLGAQNKKYEFIACDNFDVKKIKCNDATTLVRVAQPAAGQPCSGQRKLGKSPIPIDSGTMYATLEIC